MSTGRIPQMVSNHQLIFMDLLHPDPAVSVPLMAGNDMLGIFSLSYIKQKTWTDQEIKYLLEIGRLLGVTVQHARIARKFADLEILLER